jgi:dUTP pyrophosphatase
MKIKIKNVPNLILPKYAHSTDAYIDIVATTDPIVVGEEISKGLYKEIDYIEYGTNLYMSPGFSYGESETFIDFRPRSSISKYNLSLANTPATGDKDYIGEYKLRFKYLFQPFDFVFINKNNDYQEIYIRINEDKIYKKGNKIAQMSLCLRFPVEFVIVEELKETVRGDGGFGSSGN